MEEKNDSAATAMGAVELSDAPKVSLAVIENVLATPAVIVEMTATEVDESVAQGCAAAVSVRDGVCDRTLDNADGEGSGKHRVEPHAEWKGVAVV